MTSSKVLEILLQRISELAGIEATDANWSRIEEWHARTRPLVVAQFPSNLEQFDKYLVVRRTFSISDMKSQARGLGVADSTTIRNNKAANDAKSKLQALLISILELGDTSSMQPVVSLSNHTGGAESLKLSTKIFVVHGHDVAMQQSVARTLENLGLTPIILHEQPDSGKTVIEKFERDADVGFAVVLLSPDDIGYKKADGAKKAKPRARENVILELGYFVGSLGRDKVMALKRGNDLDPPSDLSGVVYTLFDDNDGWKGKLVKELQAAGYSVDANHL